MNRFFLFAVILFPFCSIKAQAQTFPYFTVNSVNYFVGNGGIATGYFQACVGDTFTVKGYEGGADITTWEFRIVEYDSLTLQRMDSVVYNQQEFTFSIDTANYFSLHLYANKDIINGGYATGIQFRLIYCPPTASFNVSNNFICQNTCIDVTDKSTRKPTAWAWDMPGAVPNLHYGQYPPPVCYTDTGIHTITLTVTNPGGSDTATQNIYVSAAPTPKLVQTEYTIPYGDSVTLQACASGYQYTWQQCPNCDSTYTITPTTKNTIVTNAVHTLPSCDVSCTYNITTTGVPEEVLIPTAFSPNGDGVNDGFGIAEMSPYRKVNAFSIYNRWGELVFNTTVQDDRWDGTYKGMAQPLGTYVWYIDMLNTLTGARKTIQGNVTLVR